MASIQPIPTHFQWKYLHPKHWLTWLGVLLMLLIGLMPARMRMGLAALLAPLVLKHAKKPMFVAARNLAHCFPDKSPAERAQLLKQNAQHFVFSLLSLGWLMRASRQAVVEQVQLIGLEKLRNIELSGRTVVFIMPHVWGLEYTGLRLNAELPMVSMAKAHKNELFDWLNNVMRAKMGGAVYYREAGMRALISQLKSGNSVFYLPDEDLGRDKSEFAPFLGTEKATLPVVGRLAKMTNSAVVPLHVTVNAQCQYQIEVQDEVLLEQVSDKQSEAAALNTIVEQVILAAPEQYMWFLRILRTRPDPQEDIYRL